MSHHEAGGVKGKVASPGPPGGGGAKAPDAHAHKSQRARIREEKTAEAFRLLERAEKWMGIEGKDQNPLVRYTYASSLFTRAGEILRIYQQWRRAAEAYERASEAEKSMAAMLQCAALAADSAELYARVDASEAERMYRISSGVFAAMGRFITAGNLMVLTGEMEEADNAKTSAAESFAAASQYYLAEDAYSLCVANLARAGAMLALEDSYEEAHVLFERAARVALDDNLTRWHSSRLVVSAGLCLVAAARTSWRLASQADSAALVARLEAYQTGCAKRDASFAVGRDRRFLLDALDTSGIWARDDFMDHVWNYDYVAKLEAHELFLCEVIYGVIKDGAPKELAAAQRAAADMNKVNIMEEEVQVEVEELAPMSHAEMHRSGLTKQLEEERKRDAEEAARDADAEFLIIHGITRAEAEKRQREDAQRF